MIVFEFFSGIGGMVDLNKLSLLSKNSMILSKN
jgi:hypothetical protein